MPQMTPDELKAILSSERSDALAAMGADKLADDRAKASDYYLGNMDEDMPPLDGRSRAVSMDVQEAIEGVMPTFMDIFCGSDEVVRFEPVGPEDELAAQQETDYVNHVFMQQNDGYMVMYEVLKDAALQKTGIFKTWWEKSKTETTETYENLTDDQFALLADDVLKSNGSLKIVAHTVEDDEVPGMPEEPETPMQDADAPA